MEKENSKKKQYLPKKEITRSITYRLPTKTVEELEKEAIQKNISHNVLVKQILERYLIWDRFADKIGMMPIPKTILLDLGKNMTGQDISTVISTIVPLVKESVMFMKGSFDLKRCIESLEDYMKASGMKSDHRIEGAIHHFIIQHQLGIKWSLFTEQLFKEIFYEFLPNKNIKFQTTDNTVIASVELGSDFSEHNY